MWPRAAPSPPLLCPRDRDDALRQGEVMWQEHFGGTRLGVPLLLTIKVVSTRGNAEERPWGHHPISAAPDGTVSSPGPSTAPLRAGRGRRGPWERQQKFRKGRAPPSSCLGIPGPARLAGCGHSARSEEVWRGSPLTSASSSVADLGAWIWGLRACGVGPLGHSLVCSFVRSANTGRGHRV